MAFNKISNSGRTDTSNRARATETKIYTGSDKNNGVRTIKIVVGDKKMPQLDQWGIPDVTDFRYEKQYGDEEHVNEAGKKYCEENPVLVACDKTPMIITDARTGISIMIDFD